MSCKRIALAVVVVAALMAPMTATAGWSNYFGEGTMYQTGPNGAGTGWAYHTNNRVWRPTGHPFYLLYNVYPNDLHWSATNWNDNPFYFGAYGYNQLGCQWEYWNDGSYSLYPVTCQGYN